MKQSARLTPAIGALRVPDAGQSYVYGDTTTPLLEITIPALLSGTVDRFPDREAAVFVEHGIRWTYDDFQREVDALAGGLLRLGLNKGDRLGVWAPNRPEWLLAQFATARLGVILVNVNPAYRTSELEFALRKTGCKALILAPRFKESDYVAMINALAPELMQAKPGTLISERLPDLRSVIVMDDMPPPGCLSFPDVVDWGRDVPSAALDEISEGLDCNDPVNIQFTSGTTGQPKGATLTHRNIVNNARFVTDAIGLTAEDRLCIPVPFYHCFGMVMGTLGCVTKGATIVVPAQGFDARTTLATLEDEACTGLYAVPTMVVAMLQHDDFPEFDLHMMRTGILAGAPVPIEIMRRVQSEMHMDEVTIAYGMTETSPVSFQSAVDDPLEKRVASVGRIQPHVEVKIVDATGQPVPVGAQGELWTRGYSVMQGYWDEPEKTSEAIDADGWMHTGDLATLDEEGFCKITGRLKDMIIRGGENIYPREIEEFLYTHPDVSQVQVFGIPDRKFGESVCAWIVPKPGATPSEASIAAFCKDRIAHYKVPTTIQFRDSLPMTVTGKPQKFEMRAAMVVELGLSEIETA
ncbi:AMP-binding protein [Tropicimonas sp. S265A]|uniref:AMP-binding protein n=1 Tax=Tropicimonas sp. S265A TaxID=3415134 RepID=UPI003C7E99DA